MRELVISRDLIDLLHWNSASDKAELHLQELFATIPSLRCRRPEARAVLKRTWSRVAKTNWSGDTLVIVPREHQSAESIAATLSSSATGLDRIASRPFTPKELCEVLEITNQERLRWTKDGRLKTSGTIVFKRANALSLPTYAIRYVVALQENSDVIEEWRAHDRGVSDQS